jgi:hypothetical protein
VGAAVIAPALVVAAIALPWLGLLPLPGVIAAVAHALTLLAAFHGAGLLVARLARRRDPEPLLAVQWGIALVIALSGLAIAAHAGTLAGQAVLVFGCAAVHTGALGVSFARYTARVELRLAGPRSWRVAAGLLIVLGALTVLGAAGDGFAQPLDDDGHLLAQLRRVLDTGALGDAIGYPRSGGLGGQVALAAVVSGAGDGFTHAIEALALALSLGLAVSRIDARDRNTAQWAVLVIAAGFGLALAPLDPLPCWIAVGLLLALHAMVCEADPPALPLGLTAGALIALRYELAPVAAVALIAVWWRRRDAHRKTAVLVAGVVAAVAPLAIARAAAWRSVPSFVDAVLAAPPQSALIVRLAIAAAIAVPGALVLQLALPERRELHWVALASAVGLAAIAAHVTGAGLYSGRLAWPIAIALLLTVIVELARASRTGPAALIAALGLCLVIYEAGEAPARLRWWRRMADAATDLGYLRNPPTDAADPYAALLARVPPGATVAVWVLAPERLDYTRHRIVDLRTPAVARLREHRWAAHVSKLDSTVTALASYLLIESDDAHIRRIQTDLLYRFVCQPPKPICADDLEAIALHHAVLDRSGNLALVDLRR